MSDEAAGLLRVDFNGNWNLGEMTGLMDALRHSYASLLNFEHAIDDSLRERGRRHRFPEGIVVLPDDRNDWVTGGSVDVDVRRAAVLDTLALDGEPLIISMHLASPGWIELLGKWNPLTAIADFVKWVTTLRYQREQLALENEKLSLENMLLANTVIAGRVQILRDAGYTKAHIRTMMNVELAVPLRRLEPFVDSKGLQAVARRAELGPAAESAKKADDA